MPTDREPHEPDLSMMPKSEINVMIEYHKCVIENKYGSCSPDAVIRSHTFLRYYERELARRT